MTADRSLPGARLPRRSAPGSAELIDAPLGPLDASVQSVHPGSVHSLRGRGLYVRRTPVPASAAGADLPVAIYVHGLSGSSSNFTAVSSALSLYARGYSPDLPGFGRSDPPPRGRYRLADFADMVRSLADELSPDRPVHLIGNSLGGMVCLLAAASRPERCSSLTLISPAVPDLRIRGERGADARLGVLLAPGTKGFALRQLTRIGPRQRVLGMAEYCYGDPSCITDAELDLATAEATWRYGLPWTHESTVQALRALMRSYFQLRSSSFVAQTAKVTAPVLTVWGDRDRLVDPALAEPTAASFTDSSLLMLPGIGHVAQMEAPEPTARAILGCWLRSPESAIMAANQPDSSDSRPGVPPTEDARPVALLPL